MLLHTLYIIDVKTECMKWTRLVYRPKYVAGMQRKFHNTQLTDQSVLRNSRYLHTNRSRQTILLFLLRYSILGININIIAFVCHPEVCSIVVNHKQTRKIVGQTSSRHVFSASSKYKYCTLWYTYDIISSYCCSIVAGWQSQLPGIVCTSYTLTSCLAWWCAWSWQLYVKSTNNEGEIEGWSPFRAIKKAKGNCLLLL